MIGGIILTVTLLVLTILFLIILIKFTFESFRSGEYLYTTVCVIILITIIGALLKSAEI